MSDGTTLEHAQPQGLQFTALQPYIRAAVQSYIRAAVQPYIRAAVQSYTTPHITSPT
jgi:hypothetical protein